MALLLHHRVTMKKLFMIYGPSLPIFIVLILNGCATTAGRVSARLDTDQNSARPTLCVENIRTTSDAFVKSVQLRINEEIPSIYLLPNGNRNWQRPITAELFQKIKGIPSSDTMSAKLIVELQHTKGGIEIKEESIEIIANDGSSAPFDPRIGFN